MARSFLWRWLWAPLALVLALPLAADEPTPNKEEAKPDEPATSAVATTVSVFDKEAPESLEDLKAIQDRVQELIGKVTPCTVGVQIGGAQGSGVIVSEEGLVLTAGHVCGSPGRKATLIMPDGSRVSAESLGRNIGMDSGMMKITEEGKKWPFVELGASKDLKAGAWCLATGHPGGYQEGRAPVVRLGRVLGRGDSAVRTDCTLVGGDSGGPLFDMDGKLIGIHSRISSSLTANFHVPIDTYHETWDRLVKAEEWGGPNRGPVIGIRGEDVEKGCRITEIFPGLPAEKAGIKEGDIVTKFDGQEIKTLEALVKAVQKKKIGDEVEIEFLRGDELKKEKVKMAALR
jgi:serine protease Do